MKNQKVDKDKIFFDGIVEEANKGIFTVKVRDNYKVLCTLSGKIRQNSVRILVGDLVKIEVGAYDPLRGRIVFRNKK